MSIMRCDNCNRSVDTDYVEMESFPCGEDDTFHLCPTCAEAEYASQEAEMAMHRRDYNAAPLSERNPEQYRQDMIDAGRGHLLPETWER